MLKSHQSLAALETQSLISSVQSLVSQLPFVIFTSAPSSLLSAQLASPDTAHSCHNTYAHRIFRRMGVLM